MLTETIAIEVEPAAARIYNEASKQDKEKMQALVEVWLKEYSASDARSLVETMDEIGANAKSRGLTPEILESLLNEN